MRIKDHTDMVRHLTDPFNIPEARRMIAENPALTQEQFKVGGLVEPGVTHYANPEGRPVDPPTTATLNVIKKAPKFKKQLNTLIDSGLSKNEAAKKLHENLKNWERAKIKEGTITEVSGDITLSRRTMEAVERLTKFRDTFLEEEGRLPTRREIRSYGFHSNTPNKLADAGLIKIENYFLSEEEARKIGGSSTKVRKDLQILNDNEKVRDAFRAGKITPETIKEIKKVLKVSEPLALDRIAQLSDAYLGITKVAKIKPQFSKNARTILLNQIPDARSRLQKVAGKAIAQSVGESRGTLEIAKDITDKYPDRILSQFYNIDEPSGRLSSYRRSTTPYGVFSQIIDRELNQYTKRQFDAQKSTTERLLQNAIKGGVKKEIETAVGNYNTLVTKYEKRLNKNKLRGQKPIRLFKVAYNQSPSQTIANFKDMPKAYQKAFLNNFKNRKYSFIVPGDVKDIFSIKREMFNPKSSTFKQLIKASENIKKHFNEYDEDKLFKKVQKFIESKPRSIRQLFKALPLRIVQGDDLSEKRYASADNIMTDATYVDETSPVMEAGMVPEFVKKNPWTSAGIGTAATAATKPGRSLLGKTFRTLGTPLSGLGWAGLNVYDKMKEGKSLADAVVDPLTGVELAFPSLFKENLSKIIPDKYQGALAKAGRGALGLGKFGARFMGPIGWGITAAGLGKEAYKVLKEDKARRESITPEQRRRAQREYFDKDEPMFAEGGIASLKKK